MLRSHIKFRIVAFVCAAISTAVAVHADETPPTLPDPRSIRHELSAVERDISHELSPEQLRAFLSGTDAREIMLAEGVSLRDRMNQKGLSDFGLPWFSMDASAGPVMTGASFSLRGTLGQAESGHLAGADFSLTGGFWSIVPRSSADPCQAPEALFCDGFESADTSAWSAALPGQASIPRSDR